METRVSEIFAEFGPTGLLTSMEGPDATVVRITAVDGCRPGDLVFVNSADGIELVRAGHPSAAVTSPENQEKLSAIPGLALLVAPNVKLARALILQRHADRDVLKSDGPAVHSSAVIGEECVIGEGSQVGPHVTLGDNVRVGAFTAIMAGSVIEHGASIGDRTVVHPRVTIGYDCEIGDEVQLQSGAVIGSEGYGFAQDETGRSHRIPQLGRVVIEDRVRVGAGTCIARATYGTTRIGAGTKFDNLCHVGHNVEIGRDCIFLPGTVIGGSCRIGDRCIASGHTGIIDHIDICSDVYLLRRAGVTENIDEPGMYAGGPVEPYRSYLRNTALAQNLTELRKQVRRLEQALLSGESEDQ